MRSAVSVAAALLAVPALACAATPAGGPPGDHPPGANGAALRRMPLDQPLRIGAVLTACTGHGQTRVDPQWLTYSIRLEFTNSRGRSFSAEEVTVYDAANRPILHLGCEAPWLLLGLTPGDYLVEAQIPGEADLAIQRVGLHPPDHGQSRVVVTFPDAD